MGTALGRYCAVAARMCLNIEGRYQRRLAEAL